LRPCLISARSATCSIHRMASRALAFSDMQRVSIGLRPVYGHRQDSPGRRPAPPLPNQPETRRGRPWAGCEDLAAKKSPAERGPTPGRGLITVGRLRLRAGHERCAPETASDMVWAFVNHSMRRTTRPAAVAEPFHYQDLVHPTLLLAERHNGHFQLSQLRGRRLCRRGRKHCRRR
jgi:hypothetical protein